jgi:hypothetical protein
MQGLIIIFCTPLVMEPTAQIIVLLAAISPPATYQFCY